MCHRRNFLKLLCLCFLPLLVIPGIGNSKVSFNMDFGRFRYDASSVYLEIYYSVYIDKSETASMKENQNITTQLDFDLLNEESDSILAHNQINVSFAAMEGKSSDSPQGSMGMLKLIVPEGKYIVRLSNASDTIQYQVATKIFSADRITMSDVELCSDIISSSNKKDSPFYKNTMEVIPNPSQVYGKGFPRLYYYVELYNMDSETNNSDAKVTLQAVIADKDGNVRMKKEYSRDFSHESTVERGAFNVNGLESGLYTLIFAATDMVNNSSVYRRRDFYVHNPDVVLASSDNATEGFNESEFKDMPESVVDDMFDQAHYLATTSEQNVYKVLNSVESKRQFLYRFWKDRNKARPGFQQEYYDRVEYASQNFSNGQMKGWKTDMGRIYLLYGPASQIDRHPIGPDENSYEIWHYHELEGGVEFDFIDLTGFGDYKLVNSTKRGELSDPNWENYIMKR
jgi:GWxTD domain-containing protein